jgi:hypothetical protein
MAFKVVDGQVVEVADDDPDAVKVGEDGEPEGAGSGEEPVVFASKAKLTEFVNGVVTDRLKRVEKKYAPIVQERDTLKTKVAELESSAPDAEKSQREFAKLQSQIEELTNYRKTTERNELVRRIAKDKGLPEHFHGRVRGDDEDAITADIDELVSLIPAPSNGTPAGTPASKGKPSTKDEAKGGKGTPGSGSSDDADVKIDIDSIPRYGQPYVEK